MSDQKGKETRLGTEAGAPTSRQVSWYETFIYATSVAYRHGVMLDHRALPIPGTVQWCDLPDDDARKLLSLIWAGVREALINDARQEAIQEAGCDVHGGDDWSWLAQSVRRRNQIDEIRKAS